MTHFITLFLMSIGVLFTNPKIGDSFQKTTSDQSTIAVNENTSSIPPTDGGNDGWDDE